MDKGKDELVLKLSLSECIYNKLSVQTKYIHCVAKVGLQFAWKAKTIISK